MLRVTFRHNRYKKLNDKGEAVIEIRLYLNKERYISTGKFIKPSEWDDKKSRVKNHTFAIELNQMLVEYEEKAFAAYFELKRKGNLSIDRIIEKIKGNTKTDNFIKFVEERISGNKNLEPSTLAQHKIFLDYIRECEPALIYSNITYTFLVKFEQFLLNHTSNRGGTFSRNYTSSLLRIFRTYVNEAIKSEHLSIDPFRGFKIRTEDTKITFLEFSEVKQIEAIEFKWQGKAKIAHDMFIFSCFTGLRISDAMSLKAKHIIEDKDGLRLIKKPKKTRKKSMIINLPLYLLFDGKPEAIIKKYLDGKQHDENVFPDISTKTYKEWLDKFADVCGIEKNITSHVARHTFAMEMLKRVRIEALQKLMAHSDLSTTQVYARLSTSTIDDILRG